MAELKTNPESDRTLPKDTITVNPVIRKVKSIALPDKEHITDSKKQPRKHCTRRSHGSDEIN